MKIRQVTIVTGEMFAVPTGIQRLDSTSTRGWQVRYQGTKYFADGAAGPQKALQAATKELMQRIATMPAPAGLRRKTSPNKTTELPVGISGPIVIHRAGTEQRAAVLSVLVPRFGTSNLVKSIHIGTPNTYTKARYRDALAKAVEMREAGMAVYEAEVTKAKRKAAVLMKKTLRMGADAGAF
jgi:hypothetical protein